MKRLFLFLLLFLLCFPLASASTHFKPVATAEADLNGKIFVNDSAAGYSAEWTADDRIAISSIIHETDKTVRIQMNALSAVNGFSGNSAKVTHINDAGVIDSERVVNFGAPDAQGFVYFTTDFSTVIIGGYQGSYTISCGGVQDNSTNCSLGQSFPGGNVSAFTGTITPATTGAGPYDINTTGLVGWWELDDDYIDSSGDGNNGTTFGDTHFVNGKYNNGTSFDGTNDYINVGNINISKTNSLTMAAFIKINDLSVLQSFVEKNLFTYIRYNPATGKFYGRISTSTSDYFPAIDHVILDNSFYFVVLTHDNTSNLTQMYLNGELKVNNSQTGNLISSSSDLHIGGFPGIYSNSTIDNVLLYNRSLSQTEIQSLYYDHLQQLRIRTTTNATWSDYYNSTADNPISINYNIGETISALQFDVPTTAVIDGVTIYDYNKTAQFTLSATVYYGENTTLVSETATAGQYHLNMSFTPANSGTGWMNYTTTNTLLLNADFNNTATFSSTETNATLAAETLPSFNISTGYMQAGIPKTFNISIDYFYPPASFSVIESSSTWINTSWAESPNADKYSLYRDDVFIANTTNLYYTYTGLSPFVGYMLNVSVWNGSRETSQAALLEYTVSPTSTIITFLDLMNNSDTEFSIYNASGAAVVTLFSNGSSHTFPPGAYVVQVLPADPGYTDSPLMLVDLLFATIKAVMGILVLLVIALGLGRFVMIIMEVRV